MARYIIPLADGVYVTNETAGVVSIGENKGLNHQMTIALEEATPVTAGSLVVEARTKNSDEFEVVPDGTFDLTALSSLLFQFDGVEQYRFTISGLTGTGRATIKDEPFGVC